jgi:superfamily II DNA/RNA helicase
MPFPPTHPALAGALDKQGYLEPTPVQAAVLGAADGQDLLVSAQTGSGKTVASAWPWPRTCWARRRASTAPARLWPW